MCEFDGCNNVHFFGYSIDHKKLIRLYRREEAGTDAVRARMCYVHVTRKRRRMPQIPW